MKQETSWKEKWLKAIAPDEPHRLDRRLTWDGISEEGFMDYLEKEARDTCDAFRWQDALEDCRAAIKSAWDCPLADLPKDEDRPFFDLWWPLHAFASSQLGALSDRFDPDICDQLADTLLERLCVIGERVLWEAFSAVRSPGTMLLAHLGAAGDGAGPPVRTEYEAFVRHHRAEGLASLLSEFPEMGRFIGLAFVLWLQSSAEMLRRIATDHDVLHRAFSIPQSYALRHVRQGLSDPHQGGRTVAILSFYDNSTDCEIRVVYKPKDMAVDLAYHQLLRDLDGITALPPFRSLVIQACAGYGYMEYVPHSSCPDEKMLARFYYNAGRLAAVLHWLGCSDCHFENLIACGDQLLLIDTETLLEPILHDHIRNASAEARPAASRLQERFDRSVLRSGLLPQWTFLGHAKEPVDISALGISSPEAETQLFNGWLGINSDGMMPGRVRRAAEVPTSLPVGVGVPNPFDSYLDNFCDGFEEQSGALFASRHILLAADGPLDRFRNLPRRIVLRGTRVYMAILLQMLEPEALRSPFAQALKLEQLVRSFLLADEKPLHWPIFGAEARQMRLLDVPFFTHLIDGSALQIDNNGADILGFMERSGLVAARERLMHLDAEEVAFQLSIIRGVVRARKLRVTDQTSPDAATASPLVSLLSPPAITGPEAVIRIAHTLTERAIRDPQGAVEWLGPNLGADGQSFVYGPVGLSLYSGAIGIASLFDLLRDQPDELPNARALQAAILRPLHDMAQNPLHEDCLRWWRDQALGLNGVGGILLALSQLRETDLVKDLVGAARARFLSADRQLDLLGGCAGLIGPLLRVNSAATQQLAVQAGDHLLSQQREDGAWSHSANALPILGFSHGVAGFAAALSRLSHATGQDRFREGAAAALAAERSYFDTNHNNWPDYRERNTAFNEPDFTVAWCNGAPGIALARACLWGTASWDDTCAQEINIAINTTLTITTQGRDHLCCGNLGLMSVLQILRDGPWPIANDLQMRMDSAIQRHRMMALTRCSGARATLRCYGTHEGVVDLPGFFTGLSGMGVALLDTPAARRMLAAFMSCGLIPDN